MANIVDIVIRGIDKTKQGLTQPIRSLEDLGKAAARVAPAMKLAAAAAASAFAYMVKNAIDLGDEMAKTSQKVGVSVESLSALKHAASLSGVEFETLSTGLRMLNKNMADTAANTGEARQAFSAMGISVKTATGGMKGTEDLLKEVADKFASYEDGANKTAIAMRIFGKAGAELIPLLNAGSSGINELMDEAQSLGLVISADAAKASEEFNDNLERLTQSVSGTAIAFASEMIPALASAAGSMAEWVKESGAAEKVGKFLAGTVKVIAAGGLAIAAAFNAAGTAIGGLFSVIATAVAEGPTAAWENAKEVFKELGVQLDNAQAKMNALESAGTRAGNKVAAAAGRSPGKKSAPDIAELGKGKAAKEIEDEFASFQRVPEMVGQAMMDAQAKMDAAEQEWAESWARLPEMIGESMSLVNRFNEAWETGNVPAAISAMNEGLAEQWALLEEGQVKIEAYRELAMDAHMGIGQAATEIGMSLRAGFAQSLASIATGSQKASDAFKALRQSAIGMVVEYAARWFTAQVAMLAFGKSAKAAEVATAWITGPAVAAAWATAAALVSLATLGGNAAPAAAALAGTVALSKSLVVAGAAHGGLTSVPSESTFLLQRGERVLSPQQNEDLTEFLGGRGGGGQIIIPVHIGNEKISTLVLEGVRWGRIPLRAGNIRVVPA